MADDLIGSQEAARLLGLSVWGLNARRRDGRLTAAQKFGGIYLFRRSDVLAQPKAAAGRRGPKPGDAH